MSDEDKKAHDKTIDELKKQDLEARGRGRPAPQEVPRRRRRTPPQKAPASARDAVGPVLVNLRQAVDDASIADGAAAVRYPLALTSLPDSVLEVVPVIVADIVEEQTGKRPIDERLQARREARRDGREAHAERPDARTTSAS